MIALLVSFFLLASLPAAAGVTEIATGSMLGPRFKPDRFYIRSARFRDWQQTYSENEYRNRARGKLMLVRAAQGLVDDEGSTLPAFDPDANTNRLMEALAVYKEHGVLAVSVSLQGAPAHSEALGSSPGNGPTAPRQAVSAFKPDGSLNSAWMERLERLLTAADRLGMVICLIYFDPSQDQVLESPETILAAARNVTQWLVDKDFRNVVIDVASEWDLNVENGWDHFNFVPENIALLVTEVRERFNNADFSLPIGASASPRMAYPASLARLCDVILLHANGRTPREKMALIRPLRNARKPIWIIEDYNTTAATLENLSLQSESARSVFQATAGWGYVPWVQAEQYPFQYLPGPSSQFTNQTPADEREAAFFRAMLEHLAETVLKRPPSTAARRN